MRIGDRVRYVGDKRPDWVGRTGTIEDLWCSGRVNVRWDDMRPVDPRYPLGEQINYACHIKQDCLEHINMIDPKRPVETTEDEPRQCRTIGLLERVEGTVTMLLELPTPTLRDPTCEIEINLTGRVIGPLGRGLSFRNVPKVESGFYMLEPDGTPLRLRGLVSLDMAKSDHPGVQLFLEIVSVDGTPKEAKLHVR